MREKLMSKPVEELMLILKNAQHLKLSNLSSEKDNNYRKNTFYSLLKNANH